MPGMGLDRTRRRMISRDGQHVGSLLQQNRQGRVKFFNRFPFRFKISVLSMHVGGLVMNKEEVVSSVLLEIALELFSQCMGPFKLRHADKLSQTFVHGINGETCRFELIPLLERRNSRLMRDATQEESIGRLSFRKQWQRRFVEFSHEF